MKNFILPFTLLLLLFSEGSLFAQQSPTEKTINQTRPLANFSFISLQMSGTVYVKQEDKFSVMIDAPEEIIDKITTEVSENTLEIGDKNKYMSGGSKPVKIYISIPKPNGLEVDGSGDIITQNNITSDFLSLAVNGSGGIKVMETISSKLNIEVNGSGDISQGKATAESIVIEIQGSGGYHSENIAGKLISVSLEGSGDIKLAGLAAGKLWMTNNGSGSIRQVSGMAAEALLDNSGSGDISAANLNSSLISISNSGSGDIIIGASETLNAELSGSGDIRYHGTPKTFRVDDSGSGSVNETTN